MFAAMSGSVAVVGSLLEAGAKPHATNKQGRTAAQIAGFIGELCSPESREPHLFVDLPIQCCYCLCVQLRPCLRWKVVAPLSLCACEGC